MAVYIVHKLHMKPSCQKWLGSKTFSIFESITWKLHEWAQKNWKFINKCHRDVTLKERSFPKPANIDILVMKNCVGHNECEVDSKVI